MINTHSFDFKELNNGNLAKFENPLPPQKKYIHCRQGY